MPEDFSIVIRRLDPAMQKRVVTLMAETKSLDVKAVCKELLEMNAANVRASHELEAFKRRLR